MNKSNIVSKGKYAYPRDERLAYVTDYLIVKEGGKKYLVLRFYNPRNEVLTKLRLNVEQLNSEGKTLSGQSVVFDNLNGCAEGVFVPEKKIVLASDCVDFKVTVNTAGYGNYSYSIVGGEVRVEYVEPRDNSAVVSDEKRKTVGKNQSIKHRKFGFSLIICLCSVLLVACITAATVLHLNSFKNTENSFSVGRVEYTFINGDKSENGTLSVTGYSGNDRVVVIPDEIEGYSIVEIAPNAFKGNNKIEKISFSSRIDVGESAFEDCAKLSEVDFIKVKSIGQRAFANCGSLASFESGAVVTIGDEAFLNCTALGKVIISCDVANYNDAVRIGESAFGYCSGLDSICIDKAIKYSGYCTIFDNCTNVTSLNLKGLGTYNNTQPTIQQLFNTVGSVLKIQEITIDECSQISSGMFQGLNELVSVTVSNCSSSVIGSYAFANCGSLTNFDLGGQITGVGDYAFQSSGITSFDFSGVTYLGSSAFEDCNNLVSAQTLENSSISFVPYNAFSSCDKLSFVTIPISAERINNNAFGNCKSLKEIVFPSESKLTVIEERAFSNCTSLVEVSLPATLSIMGEYAFLGCSAMKSINIPSLSFINRGAFKGCSSLSAVTLPNGVNSIGTDAFANCSQLKTVSLPSSLQTIGEGAFSGCSLITEIIIPDAVNEIGYGAFNGCNSLGSYTAPYAGGSADMNTYFNYVFGSIGSNVVPKSLETVTLTSAEKLDYSAFEGCQYIKKINLPDGLTQIGGYAFENCSSLSDLVIPTSVQSLGFGAFSGCTGLKTLTLPFVGQSYSENGYLAYNFGGGNYDGFYLPQSLNSVTITKATKIGEYAFNGNQYLKQINLPDSLMSIGKYAFEGCSRLNKINLPKNLMTISDYAFNGCYRLYEVKNDSSLKLTVGSLSLGGVAQYALKVYSSTAAEAQHVEADGYEFAELNGKWYLVAYPCEGNKSLSLPETFSASSGKVSEYAIAPHLFFADDNLSSVTVPYSVKELGEGAFESCINLLKVDISADSQITTLPYYCFSRCISLSQFEMPSSVTSIRSGAFNNCYALKSITVTDNLTDIERDAFVDCFSLLEVTNNSSLKIEKGSSDYGNVAKWALVVYTPGMTSGKVSYFTVNGIKFAQYEEEYVVVGCDPSLNEINFTRYTYNNKSIRSYSIAPGAFRNNHSLTSVTFGKEVTAIGDEAFSFCANVNKVTFGGTELKSIGDYAFEYCEKIQTLVLPSGLSVIGSGAFQQCIKLQSVKLPSSLISIKDYAFNGCLGLLEVYNESSLNLQKGSSTHGCVALNAMFIYDSADAVSLIAYQDDYMFVKVDGKWKLFSFNGNIGDYQTVYVLPSSFVHNGITVSSYTVSAGVFKDGETSATLSLVIPKSVTSIDDKAFSIYKIYYSGTKTDWAKLTGGREKKFSQYVYYYADCVHESYVWSYDKNGQIIYTKTGHYETSVEPTCSAEGEERLLCSYCNNVLETYKIARIEHSLNANDECTVCGEKGVTITQDNIDDLGLTTNDSKYPYTLGADGVFSSINTTAKSQSVLIVKADKKMQIVVSFEITGNSSDYMSLSCDGSVYEYYPKYVETKKRVITLDASKSLKITFTCGNTVSNNRGVKIKLKIFFLSEGAA